MAKGGFRGMPGGMGGMNQAQMMKQAQKMQQELLRMQEEQESKVYTAKAGGGIMPLGGETEQSVNHYLIAKSGLERNREFTVRDALAEMDKMDRQIINGA